MVYNLTNVTNSSNFLELTKNTNELTGDLLGFMILISFFFVMFISFKGTNTFGKAAAASFITTLISFLFKIIGLTGDKVVISFVLITALTFILASRE